MWIGDCYSKVGIVSIVPQTTALSIFSVKVTPHRLAVNIEFDNILITRHAEFYTIYTFTTGKTRIAGVLTVGIDGPVFHIRINAGYIIMYNTLG